jgi:hypothetical protein
MKTLEGKQLTDSLVEALRIMESMHEWRDADMIHHNEAETVRHLLRMALHALDPVGHNLFKGEKE